MTAAHGRLAVLSHGLRRPCDLPSTRRSRRPAGRPNVAEAWRRSFEATEDEIDAGLRALHDARQLVLGDDRRDRHGPPVLGRAAGLQRDGTRACGGAVCAWDAFALPHVVTDEPDVLVATRCPACDGAARLGRRARRPAATETQVAHFLVPTRDMWADVVNTCANQRLFCSSRRVAKLAGRRPAGSAATCSISRPCGGWRRTGTTGAWTAATRAASPRQATAYFAAGRPVRRRSGVCREGADGGRRLPWPGAGARRWSPRATRCAP